MTNPVSGPLSQTMLSGGLGMPLFGSLTSPALHDCSGRPIRLQRLFQPSALSTHCAQARGAAKSVSVALAVLTGKHLVVLASV